MYLMKRLLTLKRPRIAIIVESYEMKNNSNVSLMRRLIFNNLIYILFLIR